MGSTTTAREAGTAFLPTKLQRPPLAPGLVTRPRLLDAMDASVAEVPLTAVQGPAGSGKTTLLSEWAGRRPAVAWVTLDRIDDDPDRFWPLILAATGAPELPGCAGDPACALAAHVSGRDEPLILVLDGIDVVDDATTLGQLERLVHCPPDGLRIVLASRRSVEGLRLSRLRVAGRARLIDAGALRLTPAEAAQVLAEAGAPLDDEDVAQVWERTEGWACAVALVALGLADGTLSRTAAIALQGDEDPVRDYLSEELLDDLDPATRRVAQHVSIVDEVDGDLAEALSGCRGAAAILDDMRRAGLPVTTDGLHGTTFRLHPLFAGLLQARLRRDQPTLVPGLHGRAARWFAEQGRPAPAMRHAVASEDAGLLVSVVARGVVEALADGTMEELTAPLRQAPPTLTQQQPVLALAQAIAAYLRGDVSGGDHWQELAERQGPAASPELLGLAALVRALATGGTVPSGSPAAPDGGVANALMGALALWSDDVAQAERLLAVAATQCEQHDRLAGMVAARLAVCRLRHGDEDGATMLATEALDVGGPDDAALAHVVLGALAHARGEDAIVAEAQARVRTLLAGEQPLAPGEQRFVAATTDGWPSPAGGTVAAVPPADLSDPLSEAELAILRYLPTMLTNGEIAGERCLSVNTVKTHLKTIYRKLGVTGRAAAVTRARELGIAAI